MASNESHYYRHTLTGQVALLDDDAASVFPNYLVQVDPDAKDAAPELFKPGTVEEYKERRNKGSKYEQPEEVAEAVAALEEQAPPADGPVIQTPAENKINLREGKS